MEVRTSVDPYDTLSQTYADLGAWFARCRLRPPDMMWEEYLLGPGSVEES